jgi:hypothetical protein
VTVGEISLNPQNIRNRPPIEVASVMLHEALHLWQHCHGKPGKSGYHNTEWGEAMIRCGLWPSHTGKEGGRMTGQQMDHYIIENGPFVQSWERFVPTGKVLAWGDAVQDPTKTRGPTRTKFECPICKLAAWSQASAGLICANCHKIMLPAGRCP